MSDVWHTQGEFTIWWCIWGSGDGEGLQVDWELTFVYEELLETSMLKISPMENLEMEEHGEVDKHIAMEATDWVMRRINRFNTI